MKILNDVAICYTGIRGTYVPTVSKICDIRKLINFVFL